ncbi:MAG: hypothetical protein QNJ26_07150 [Desulfobacterales bacterium]|nr:hypothetical protein [Desulfobacterales bacterium]
MTETSIQNTAADKPVTPPPGWRFRLGVIFFALGCITPVGAAIVALTNLSPALKATLGGLFLVGGPEVCTILAVAFMGKAGFAYVKNRLLAMLRRYGPPKEVGRVRYYIGLVMWLIPAVYAWVLTYMSLDWLPGFPEYRIPIALSLDFIFICSFLVLGGDFWDKVRSLFVYRAKASFPESTAR